MILLLVAALQVGADRAPTMLERRGYDCPTIRQHVQTLGENAVIAMARAKGIPENVIAEAARRCRLRK